jgi:hypothetical protein
MKTYISRIAVAASLGMFALPALTPSAEPQTRPWWFYGCPKGVRAQIPGDVPGRALRAGANIKAACNKT